MIKTLQIKSHLIYFILFLGLLVRLHGFTSPVADWHSWRQADTSAVSRNFIKHGFDILHPRFDDLSNVPSGIDNPKGLRFVEFPIYNLLQAGGYKLFGIFTIEEWGRIVSIIASLFSSLFLYLIVKKAVNLQAGLFTAFYYTFIPYSIYYSRTILPDPTMVMASLGGIYFFYRYTTAKTYVYSDLLISLVFTAIACLLKPYAIFFTLPMGILGIRRFGNGIWKRWDLMLYAVVALLPLALWRHWILQFPEGIPANKWLYNGNGIRFHPAFFRWILYERLFRLIFGFFGTIPFLYGLYNFLRLKEWGFLLSFLAASLVYVCVFATGNVQHDYYQILILPSLTIWMGIGATYLLDTKKLTTLSLRNAVLMVSIVGMEVIGWHIVRDYFNINNPAIVAAGKVVDAKTPKDAKVIALYNGDTSFLYQTNRQGWSSFEKPLEQMISMGAGYIVISNPTKNDLSGFGKQYQVIAHSSQYLLVKLK